MVRTGRPREFDENAAVQQAMELFWTRGYPATSIQDLVDALGVQRGSLYAAFGNKESLMLRALSCYSGMLAPAMAGLFTDDQVVPHLREYLMTPLRPAAENPGRGCLLGNTSVEMAPDEPRLADAVRQGLALLEETLTRGLERAYDLGELPRRDARTQARMLMAVQQGLQIMARTTPDPLTLTAVADSTMDSLRAT